MIRYEVYDDNSQLIEEYRNLDTAKAMISIRVGNLYWTDWHALGRYRVMDGRRSQGDETLFSIVEIVDTMRD